MPEAARKGDPHTCPKVAAPPTPAGIIDGGEPKVLIEFLPAARAKDPVICASGGKDAIAQGCGTVLINSKHAARVTDRTSHNGAIMAGAGTVIIGVMGDAVTVVKIDTGSEASKSAESKKSKDGQAEKQREGEGNADGEKEANESVVGSGSDGGVFARFRLVSPEAPKLGDELVFECTSWDPDTGGSNESPNPEAIIQRTWGVGGPGLRGAGTDTGSSARWSITPGEDPELQDVIPTSTDASPKIVRAHVILEVTDRQNHRALTSLDIDLRIERVPKAVITRLPKNSEQIRAMDTPRTTVYLRCDSYDDIRSTTGAPTPNRILSRSWTARTPKGTQLYVTKNTNDGRFASINPVFYSPGTGYQNVEIATQVYVKLRIVTAYGEDTSDEIELTLDAPEAKITGSKVLRLGDNGWQHDLAARMGKDILVEGDGLIVNAEISSTIVVDSIVWRVEIGNRVLRYTTAVPQLIIDSVDAGGLDGSGGKDVMVTIETVNGFRGDEYPTMARLIRHVNPRATWENVRHRIALSALEFGEGLVLAVVAGSIVGTLPATLAATGLFITIEMAQTVIHRGLQDLGAPSWLVSLLVMSTGTISREGVQYVKISLSRQQSSQYMYKEVSKHLKSLDSNVLESFNYGSFQRYLKHHFEVRVPGLRDAVIKDLVADGLEDAISRTWQERNASDSE